MSDDLPVRRAVASGSLTVPGSTRRRPSHRAAMPAASRFTAIRAMPVERPPRSLTGHLEAWRQGSSTAFGTLLDEVYGQLRAMAAKRLRAGGTVTLSPTELVHEALLGLMPAPREFQSRVHFFATMSLAIRSILVDQARARSAGKRGGGLVRITLSGLEVGDEQEIVDLLAIDEALTRLEALDPRSGQILHLACFGGLTREEIAGIVGLSVPTIDRELRFARAWLNKALGRKP